MEKFERGLVIVMTLFGAVMLLDYLSGGNARHLEAERSHFHES